MSENSSDSESSCGWTIINHEGSDEETLHPQNGEPYYDLASVLQSHTGEVTNVLAPEQAADCVQEQQYEGLEEQRGTSENAVPCVESQLLAKEETQPAPEVSFHGVSAELENVPPNGLRCQEKGNSLADGQCEAASDDSDIVTLEVEAVGALDKGTSLEEQVEDTGDVNLSSSFISQYTIGHADTVFPAQPSVDESSNDEASDDSGPFLRRTKRSASYVCEPENSPPIHQPVAPKHKSLFQLGSLNKCIILAMVIAISMGFGHFYGTIQILERRKMAEKMAEKIHEEELNDMKDDLFQCQKDQEITMEQQDVVEQLTEDLEERQDMVSSLKGLMDKMIKENQLLRQKHTDLKLEADDLSTRLETTEVKKSLVVENQHLRESLEKDEQALSSLQEELRKLREQIRNLEEKGKGEIMLSENHKLKAHLIEERQKVHSFCTQKENLLTESQILRTELDNERQITEALKAQLEDIANREAPESENSMNENEDIQHLQERLYDLENKLNFEQQRSDLWERLYVEAKEQNKKLETDGIHDSKEKEQSKSSKARDKSKKKAKDTFFSSVKDTFDAMKNSTKEFVRHHKEKIKQAKDAVKENLKKFSDSVKTTFRHFKDSTKNMFDKSRYKKYTERRREEAKESNTVRREYDPEAHQYGPKKATVTLKEYKQAQNAPSTGDQNAQKSDMVSKESIDQYSTKKGCSGVFECAHQESIGLFNKVLDPVRMEEFNHLMQIYVQGQVGNFRHWKELQQFINRFFHNGVFIHDQMLFTDFVNKVEDYLEDMEEYQTKNGRAFEDLDEFVYRHFFGNTYPNSFGPRKPEKNSLQKDPEAQRYRKQEQKNSQYCYRRDGKWQKHGRTNGRHMANVEIELGQLPFDPKY